MNTQIAKLYDGSIEELRLGKVYSDYGSQITPTSATLDVTLDDGSITLGGTPDINSSTGEISYNWLSAEETVIKTSLPRLNCRAVWTIVHAAGTIERVQYFDVRLVALRTDINTYDIISAWPTLNARRDVITGVTTTTGTTTTLIDTDKLHTYPANYFQGGLAIPRTGAARGEERIISLLDRENARITVERAFSIAIENETQYEIRQSWNPQISEAWTQLQARAREWYTKGEYLSLLDGYDFRQAHLYLSLAICGETLSGTIDDAFEKNIEKYRALCEFELGRIKAKIDSNIGSTPSTTITQQSISRFWGK